MSVLLDTNILLRMSNKLHPMHVASRESVMVLEADGLDLTIVPQVLYEYWVVATRPLNVNGLGLTCSQVEVDVNEWCELFKLLLDERGIFPNWYKLVRAHSVTGKPAHDARLVAAMERHRISFILTFNTSDFVRYPNIQSLTPNDIISGARFPAILP